jgi:flagellar protein FlaG
MPSENAIEKQVEHVNKMLEPVYRKLNLKFDKTTERVVVKVINTETNEIVREIPTEETRDFLAKIMEQAGILVDKES